MIVAGRVRLRLHTLAIASTRLYLLFPSFSYATRGTTSANAPGLDIIVTMPILGESDHLARVPVTRESELPDASHTALTTGSLSHLLARA